MVGAAEMNDNGLLSREVQQRSVGTEVLTGQTSRGSDLSGQFISQALQASRPDNLTV